MIRVREENINTSAFWDMVWEEEPDGTGLTTSRWAAVTVGLKPAAKVLDVGGGRGEFLEWLGDSYDRTLIDHSRFAVTEALDMRRCESGVVKDCRELPFPDDTFDAAFCNEVLEHVEWPYFLVEELRRVTKPGGLVGITTPLANTVDDKQHVWSFTTEDVTAFFWVVPEIMICEGPTIVARAEA